MRAAEKQMKMLADQLKSQEETSIAAAEYAGVDMALEFADTGQGLSQLLLFDHLEEAQHGVSNPATRPGSAAPSRTSCRKMTSPSHSLTATVALRTPVSRPARAVSSW